MVDIQTLSIAVAAVSVVAGVIYYSFRLRNLVKTRQTDLVIRLYSHFGDVGYQQIWTKFITTDFKDYTHARALSTKVGREQFFTLVVVGNFFEGIGVLLHRKLLDVGTVSDLLPVTMTWEKLKPIAERVRKEVNSPHFFEWFEYLYNEIQKREQRLQH